MWHICKFVERNESTYPKSLKNSRSSTQRHIIIKWPKTRHKKRILKTAREKQFIRLKGSSTTLTAEHWGHKRMDNIQIGNKNSVPGKIVLQNWKIKTFLDKARLSTQKRITRFLGPKIKSTGQQQQVKFI